MKILQQIMVFIIVPVLALLNLIKGPRKYKDLPLKVRKWFRVDMPDCKTADDKK